MGAVTAVDAEAVTGALASGIDVEFEFDVLVVGGGLDGLDGLDDAAGTVGGESRGSGNDSIDPVLVLIARTALASAVVGAGAVVSGLGSGFVSSAAAAGAVVDGAAVPDVVVADATAFAAFGGDN